MNILLNSVNSLWNQVSENYLLETTILKASSFSKEIGITIGFFLISYLGNQISLFSTPFSFEGSRISILEASKNASYAIAIFNLLLKMTKENRYNKKWKKKLDKLKGWLYLLLLLISSFKMSRQLFLRCQTYSDVSVKLSFLKNSDPKKSVDLFKSFLKKDISVFLINFIISVTAGLIYFYLTRFNETNGFVDRDFLIVIDNLRGLNFVFERVDLKNLQELEEAVTKDATRAFEKINSEIDNWIAQTVPHSDSEKYDKIKKEIKSTFIFNHLVSRPDHLDELLDHVPVLASFKDILESKNLSISQIYYLVSDFKKINLDLDLVSNSELHGFFSLNSLGLEKEYYELISKTYLLKIIKSKTHLLNKIDTSINKTTFYRMIFLFSFILPLVSFSSSLFFELKLKHTSANLGTQTSKQPVLQIGNSLQSGISILSNALSLALPSQISNFIPSLWFGLCFYFIPLNRLPFTQDLVLKFNNYQTDLVASYSLNPEQKLNIFLAWLIVTIYSTLINLFFVTLIYFVLIKTQAEQAAEELSKISKCLVAQTRNSKQSCEYIVNLNKKACIYSFFYLTFCKSLLDRIYTLPGIACSGIYQLVEIIIEFVRKLDKKEDKDLF